MASYLALVGFLVVIGVLVWYFYFRTKEGADGGVGIIKASITGQTPTEYAALLPLSFNQPEGIVYSYAGWVLVRDFTKGYGQKRRIFSKENAPGMYIDSTSNSFVFHVATYGAEETILVPNIPANKWIHFAIVVNQYSVQIYINGILRQYHTLGQLPRQNTDVVKVGPGWEGTLGELMYYPRALTPGEVDRMTNRQPPDDLYVKPANPQYFDITWYIGRLNPTN